MDANRFDAITRLFASRRTRRAAVGGGLGLATAAIGGRALAQNATPTTTGEGAVHPNAGANVTELFTQAFESGTWAQVGSDDTYTLTLTGVAAQTIYFSDRPERLFGLTSMQDFISSLDSEPSDPPNAALITQDPDSGDEDILLVVLENPTYDAETSTLTYDATVLTDYQQGGLSSAAIQQQDYEFPDSFGEGGLFIDGLCVQRTILTCRTGPGGPQPSGRVVGTVGVGQCWDFAEAKCDDCHSDAVNCADAFPNWCGQPGSGVPPCTATSD